MISDDALLALCVWSEARGETPDGKAAVARVVLNRRKRRYQSDGTIPGTVLWPNQFSGFWFNFIDGQYQRVCHTRAEAEARAAAMLVDASHTSVWGACANIADAVDQGSYHAADGYAQITDDALLYLNPAIINPAHMPVWADPAKQVCVIGHHTFYRA